MQNPPPGQQQQGYGSPYGTPPNAPMTPTPGGGPTGKSSIGLDANVAALVAYIATWITGLIIYLTEKENRFVRFHAMQAILLGVTTIVIYIGLGIVMIILRLMSDVLALLGGLLWLLFGLAFFAAWIFCMIKAYQGQLFKLPVIGDMAEKIVNK